MYYYIIYFYKTLQTLSDELANKEIEYKDIKIYFSKELKNYDKISEIYYKLKSLRDKYKSQKKEYISLQNTLKTQTQKLSNLQQEYNKTKEYFDYLEAKQIVLKYEEDRKILKPNTPCPLCGSLSHPFIDNPPPSSDEYKNTKQKLQNLETKINTLNQEISNNQTLLNAIDLESIKKEGQELAKSLAIEESYFDTLKAQKEHNNKFEPIKNRLNIEITTLKTKIQNLQNQLQIDNKNLSNLQNEVNSFERYPNPKQEKSIIQKEYDEVLEKEKELSNSQTLLKTKEDELNENQINFSKIKVENKDYKLLIEKIDIKLNEYNKQLGALNTEIEYLTNELSKNEKLQKEIKEKNEIFTLYQKINSKIGSKNGDKLKRIAINYMMDNLLNVCNIHLDVLSNQRYILERSEKLDELELFVCDRWYANAIRSVNTLSGGEKFLVSLALSFGLSDILQKQVKIETMFLDEGFGSLSEDVLDIALNRLKKASDGKTIGIISHVETLKQEISKQIKVIKKGKKSIIGINT